MSDSQDLSPPFAAMHLDWLFSMLVVDLLWPLARLYPGPYNTSPLPVSHSTSFSKDIYIYLYALHPPQILINPSQIPNSGF